MTLLELAERCEKAEGPDRELDAAITRMLYREAGCNLPGDFKVEVAWEYTASIDAALSLVPEGWAWTVANAKPDIDAGPFAAVGDHIAEAATPALALCAAALRARGIQ